MIRAIPDRFLSWNLAFFENETLVAQLRSSWWRRPSHLIIGDNTYQLYREKTFSGTFVIELDGRVIAHAAKDRTYGGRFVLNYQGNDYHFHATWPYGWFALFWSSTFILYKDDKRVGKVVSKSALKKEIMIDLPDEIDLVGKVFITWLAIAMWKRGLFGSG